MNQLKYYQMKHRIFFYQLIGFLFLCSCSDRKQAEPIRTLTHQTVDLGEDFIGYGGYLTICQGDIVGLELSPSMQPFFHIKPDGPAPTLLRFGNKGQGPNDFLQPISIQYIDSQTVGTFDIRSKTYYEFGIPNENEELKVSRELKFQASLYRVIKTAFDQYIGLSFDEKMFLLMDSAGVPVDTYFEYPYQNEDERRLAVRSMAYQGMLTANPSKDKFVYSSYQGEIIHFYAIENNGIKTIAKIENEYPVYEKRTDESGGVTMGADGKNGYVATYATKKFVYAIFSGKTILEQNGNTNFEGELLRIFDWNGVLVKEYELDVPCSYLCISDDDRKMWAVASSPDIAPVSFDLAYATENKPDDEAPKVRNIAGIDSNTVFYGIDYSMAAEGLDDEAKERLVDSIKSILDKGIDIREIYPGADVQIDTLVDNIKIMRIVIPPPVGKD
jgi:hypothetical protein